MRYYVECLKDLLIFKVNHYIYRNTVLIIKNIIFYIHCKNLYFIVEIRVI